MKLRYLIATVVLALAAAACYAGGKIDACKLVSAAAAAKVLGTHVTVKPQDTSLAGPGAASICHYMTGSAHGGFMLLAGRLDYRSATAEAAKRKKKERSGAPAGMAKPVFTDVKGLGEAAYLAKTPSYFQLHVLDRGTVIVINMNRNASPEATAQAEKIARIALAHLK